MKKALTISLIFGLGLSIGRLFDAAPPRAEAGGGKLPLPPCQDLNGDGSSDVTNAVFFLGWLFLGGPEPACAAGDGPAGVPDTGQTVCYGFDEDRGWGALACEGVICSGQDSAYATGCPMAGRFADNGDGTVTDHCTGLRWQKNTGDVNGDAQSTDQDSVTWCAALSTIARA